MKKILLFLATIGGLGAQTLYNFPTEANKTWQILPQAVPTSAADAVVGDAYIDQLQLSNTTAGALTCTVNDKQASPLGITPGAISIAANTIYIIPLGGRWAPGGIRWVCSGAGVVGWMNGTKRGTAVINSTTGD